MSFCILFLSIFGICVVYYIMNNTKYLNSNVSNMVIRLYIYDVKDVDREQIILDIKSGNFTNILDIVDKIRIN